MHDGVGLEHERLEHAAIADVAADVACLRVGVRRPGAGAVDLRLEVVEDAHGVAARDQAVHEVRADVAGAAGDENVSDAHVRELISQGGAAADGLSPADRRHVEPPGGADAGQRRARHRQVPLGEAVGVGVVRLRRHAQKRRQVREAAVGAHERARAGHRRGLHRQVVARLEMARQALNAQRLQVVAVVVVEAQTRRQRHDRAPLRQRLQRAADEGTVLVGGRKAVVEVELHRGVRARGRGERRGRVGRQPGVGGVRVHPRLADVPPPEGIEQPVHAGGVQHRSIVDVGRELAQQLALERQHLRLLLLAVGGHPLVVTAAELLRRQVVERLAVAAGKRAVPGRGAAARHDQQPLGRDVKPRREPAQKRHPVEQFEPHFPEPGSGDDGVAAGGDRGQATLEPRRVHAGHLGADAMAYRARHQLFQSHRPQPACSHPRHRREAPGSRIRCAAAPVLRGVDGKRLAGIDQQRQTARAVDAVEPLDRVTPEGVHRAVARVRGPRILPAHDGRALRQERPQHAVLDLHHVVGRQVPRHLDHRHHRVGTAGPEQFHRGAHVLRRPQRRRRLQQQHQVRRPPRAGERSERVLQHRQHRRVVLRQRRRARERHFEAGAAARVGNRGVIGAQHHAIDGTRLPGGGRRVVEQRAAGQGSQVLAWHALRAATRRHDRQHASRRCRHSGRGAFWTKRSSRKRSRTAWPSGSESGAAGPGRHR